MLSDPEEGMEAASCPSSCVCWGGGSPLLPAKAESLASEEEAWGWQVEFNI